MRYIIISLILLLFACSTAVDVPESEDKPIATCHDGILNMDEEQVDCGGSCNACASCTDGIKNQGEIDIDCGGPCKDACPTCFDKIKNQGEVDIDCGGPCQSCQTDYEIKADDANALKAKLKPNVKAALLPVSYPTGLLIGQHKVFALGITNTYTETFDFMVDLKFKEAKNSKLNLIEDVDPETVLKWFDGNEFQDAYNLEKYGQVFIPIGVLVGENIAAGIETKPGTYYFTVDVTYQKSQYTVKEHASLDFSFKVK